MAQQTLEHFIPAFFARWAESTGVRNFGYAGGVASNIKVNRLIRTAPGIDRLEVCPAMGDGGLALGAALAVWRKVAGTRPAPFSDFRLGPEHNDLGVEAVAVARESGAVLSRPADIAEAVADLVADGEVVMWAQGRMELGARALGARSIVARADSIAARDALNLRLKRRVWFQPFCPTMLESEAPQLLADFRGERDVNRHMTNGFLTTPAAARRSPEPSAPTAPAAPRWWPTMRRTLGPVASRREARTGVGAVINTSLNVHGKPMPDSARPGRRLARERCAPPRPRLGPPFQSQRPGACPSPHLTPSLPRSQFHRREPLAPSRLVRLRDRRLLRGDAVAELDRARPRRRGDPFPGSGYDSLGAARLHRARHRCPVGAPPATAHRLRPKHWLRAGLLLALGYAACGLAPKINRIFYTSTSTCRSARPSPTPAAWSTPTTRASSTASSR
jgi:hypothetical protein